MFASVNGIIIVLDLILLLKRYLNDLGQTVLYSEKLDKKADKILIDVIHPDHWNWKNVLLQGRLGKAYMKIEHIMAKMRKAKESK